MLTHTPCNKYSSLLPSFNISSFLIVISFDQILTVHFNFILVTIDTIIIAIIVTTIKIITDTSLRGVKASTLLRLREGRYDFNHCITIIVEIITIIIVIVTNDYNAL